MQILILLCLWLAMLVATLVRGGRGRQSIVGVECGSVLFWSCSAGVVLGLLLFVGWVFRLLREQHRRRHEIGHTFMEGDLLWYGNNACLQLGDTG
jgi:hypothetical protein